MREGLLFVHNTLVGAGCAGPQDRRGRPRDQRFDIACVLGDGRRLGQFGARLHVRARLRAVAELQHQQVPDRGGDAGRGRQRGLVVADKTERVANFHRLTVCALAEMLAAAGLTHPDQLTPHHLVRRISTTEIRPFAALHTFLHPGALLDGSCHDPIYRDNWARASADSFHAAPPPIAAPA
jgi:hypothetical protein